MRLLAIDPSLRSTGFAVLERDAGAGAAGRVRALEYGAIQNAAGLLPSECLAAIHGRLAGLIAQYQPAEAAAEAVIYVQSHRTAITLGAARGAAILALAQHGIPVYEYAPTDVKLAVAGRGGAAKEQVAFMVRAMLGLTETPQADAADALAIGLTHFQSGVSARLGVKKLKRI